jgi:hypothetical protein
MFTAAMAALSYSQIGAADEGLWHEFGLEAKTVARVGPADATIYRMKDLTGAVAAWEWQRAADSRPCELDAFCSSDGKGLWLASANYMVEINGPVTKPQWDAFLRTLPNRHDSSLPALLTYVPRKNLVPNSARYVLGPESLRAFAPQLASVKPGFEQGAEAQVAEYRSGSGDPLHLALFYYPTPEMARIHLVQFKQLSDVKVKRSDVLLAVVFGGAAKQSTNSLLSRIEYEAKITWNETPPPNPIKPLYQLLQNIIFMSLVLVALCSMAGLIYAGIRLYRRRFGTLEDDEAMTTLHLSGD